MAFENDAGMSGNNSESCAARDAWIKPEVLSFEPVAATQSALTGPTKDAISNVS